jgi:hypothetical protein
MRELLRRRRRGLKGRDMSGRQKRCVCMERKEKDSLAQGFTFPFLNRIILTHLKHMI